MGLRCCIGKSQGIGGEDALAANNCSRSWLQIKAVSSKANKADLETKVQPVARLNAGRAACGIGVPGGPECEPIDEGGKDC